ncbi:Oidioi.mRNA.OKI2018_I69.chr1.g3678.t1.cds [Oikopleura dioica]|uniref:Oidioi.mRNA.OKI2018_I69.chr1.g3678.t1.cds n=1 Tax=Oikopleura dioica TaxID=34765 RepID=A0ABN7SZ68_OIKDI|nr:Oidioi.mRNA.OKI2018_I69.chr1.g3678.t1.cds [Oikopleura dioica]
MIFLFLFTEVASSCSLFNVDCQETGALLTLNSECHNSTSSSIDANLLNLFMVNKSHVNDTVSTDCKLSTFALLEYSKCFDNFTDANSVNYTSTIVESVTVDGTDFITQKIERIFCEPSIEIKSEKPTLLLSSLSSNGKIPVVSPNVTLDIQGGEGLGSIVNVSIEEITEDGLYRRDQQGVFI